MTHAAPPFGLMASYAPLSALRLARLASAYPRQLHLNLPTTPTATHRLHNTHRTHISVRTRAMSDAAPTTSMANLTMASGERTVLLFAGQGAQTVGMTREQLSIPAVSRMYDVANEALGYDLKQIVLEGVHP